MQYKTLWPSPLTTRKLTLQAAGFITVPAALLRSQSKGDPGYRHYLQHPICVLVSASQLMIDMHAAASRGLE